MLHTLSLERELSSVQTYIAIYAAAALALASIYYLPGVTGALLGVSIWAFGLVPLLKLIRQRWLEPKTGRLPLT